MVELNTVVEAEMWLNEFAKTPIDDWRQLRPGMHVKISCGCQCEGFVLEVREDADDPSNNGFYIAYTKQGDRDQCATYLTGYGPYCNMFNYEPEEFTPLTLTPVPDWWAPLAKVRSWPLRPHCIEDFR